VHGSPPGPVVWEGRVPRTGPVTASLDLEAAVTESTSPAVGALNTMLMIELTALNQYFLHSKLCSHWGYERLAAKFRELSMEEMRDAEAYTDRILQLDGMPNFQKLGPVQIGHTPTEQLSLARDAEANALTALREGIVACEAAGDMATAGMLREAAQEEMLHLAWAQAQLRLVDQLGEINYLTTQVLP
jgi:bacterioferritin